jgi:hypothetical protein
VVATITGETVRRATVSKLTRDLDQTVRQFIGRGWGGCLDAGQVSLRVRRRRGAAGADAGGVRVRRDGAVTCAGFCAWGEGQGELEALLQDLYRRGLEGRSLGLILTDGCASWLRRFGQFIRECSINAAGCTRCAIF